MILAVLQARSSSSRFPGKVLADLEGMPMIMRQINRVKNSKLIDMLIVATSRDRSDDLLTSRLLGFGVKTFRGELENVASRYVELIKQYEPEIVVRLTADCPLADARIIDEVIKRHLDSGAGYTSNTLNPTFPDGLDVECFDPKVLLKLMNENPSQIELEHVTYGLYSRKGFCKVESVEQTPNLSNLRWTVDVPADLDFINAVYRNFPKNPADFDQEDIVNLIRNNPELNRTSDSLERNAGLKSQSEN